MDNIKQRLITLLEAKKLTAEESRWLLNYLEENDSTILQQLMQTTFNEDVEHKNFSGKEDISKELLQNIHQVLKSRQTASAGVVRKMQWKKIAIAASVIFLLGLSAYFILGNRSENPQQIVKNSNTAKDIAAPLNSKATITLANGETVLLDSLTNGLLANEGDVAITKTADGQIIYNGAATETAYNTLANPRGSNVINLTLSDGTKVWLNNESSLNYPVAFSGAQRKVSISGEAYFEVAKNAAMPFLVDVAGKGEVEVLGTHFNVNAYADEADVKTTLLEGKVKANFGQKSLELFPNQQSVFKNESNSLHLKKDVDVNKITAWKNGLFDFEDDDITDIMRQLARWYDVQIEYNGKITQQHFTGAIPKKVSISKVLKMLEQAGGVHYTINNKTIIIKTD